MAIPEEFEKQNAARRAHSMAEQSKPISMHDDIPVWYDCCSCEAEPYWLEAMAQPEGSAREETEK